MKNIIPFEKELDFHSKVCEILSISLEKDYEILDSTINGNLYLSGDYKSHEVSANEVPFQFKIPFSVELTDNIDKDSIYLDIHDFSYDMIDDSKMVVKIELEFEANELDNNTVEEVRKDELFIPVLEDEVIEEEHHEVKKEEHHEVKEDIKNNEEYMTYHIHIVCDNETLESICNNYHVDKSLLEEYNDISNITIGSKLIIPECNE